ncbi:unnamed protein product [Rotaria sordida]|uniref:Uncharacterized protein n=1 Tax=Rotaria sordida TaxID=392033 RepID=A0A814MV75_9BILA|nr:unnamed protein product [Rotaria sordida]CAF3911337.1 unnamed protein product [Rotaria sordida]
MSKQEHPDLSDVERNPTNRYLISYVNLYNVKCPRPSSLFTEDMIKTSKLDLRDRMLCRGESVKQQEQRRKLLDEFQRLKNKISERLTNQKQQRIQLYGGIDIDSLFEQQTSNIGEEIVEFLIKTVEVKYKP